MPKDRPRRRAPLWGLLATCSILLLAACQSPPRTTGDAWTVTDLAEVFDLGELGATLAVAPSGDHLLLDGRPLPAEVLGAFPHMTHGRTSNLLRLADDALLAMAPEVATHLLLASPTELRAHLDEFGLSLPDLRRAWGSRGELDLAGLVQVADGLDRLAAGQAALGAAGGAGARLLDVLGVRR